MQESLNNCFRWGNLNSILCQVKMDKYYGHKIIDMLLLICGTYTNLYSTGEGSSYTFSLEIYAEFFASDGGILQNVR